MVCIMYPTFYGMFSTVSVLGELRSRWVYDNIIDNISSLSCPKIVQRLSIPFKLRNCVNVTELVSKQPKSFSIMMPTAVVVVHQHSPHWLTRRRLSTLYFNGSNTFGTMKICSRQGCFDLMSVNHSARIGGKVEISFRFSLTWIYTVCSH